MKIFIKWFVVQQVLLSFSYADTLYLPNSTPGTLYHQAPSAKSASQKHGLDMEEYFNLISRDMEVQSKCPDWFFSEFSFRSTSLGKSGQLTADSAITGFGYSYDSLKSDLDIWESSPHVTISSLGKSVYQKEIYLLTLTQNSEIHDSMNVITMHNRTHPLEVQSWWVQKEMITFLLSEVPLAISMRNNNVYYMIPMINPDGVDGSDDITCDAGFGRCNALGVDLEREWATSLPQQEVAAVKSFYKSLMDSENPINIALNLHSSFGCDRFFWYHKSEGTSEEYTFLEQEFITAVVEHSQGLIEPWDNPNYQSWSSITPDYFPEGWFWLNYGKDVLALTYEDVKNCEAMETDWDIPAMALLKGIEVFLNKGNSAITMDRENRNNSVNSSRKIEFWKKYNILGRVLTKNHFIGM